MSFLVENIFPSSTSYFVCKVHDNVEGKLQGINYYSATIDLWSSKGLLSYIRKLYYSLAWWWMELQNPMFNSPSDYTATNMADALKDIQQTWKLPDEGQMSITTDNGTNMVSVANILEWQRLLCFGHNLNLVVVTH